MSGSSGGGGYDPAPKKDCRDLVTRGSINSPDPKVLAKVKEGYFVEISLRSAPAGPILASTETGELLGSVFIADKSADVIECINNGTEFRGKITEIKGGKVVIRISAK